MVGETSFVVEYPTSSVVIPSNADAVAISLFRESVEPATKPDLEVKVDGISYDWDEWLPTEASTEHIAVVNGSIVRVYSDSFEWDIAITRP